MTCVRCHLLTFNFWSTEATTQHLSAALHRSDTPNAPRQQEHIRRGKVPPEAEGHRVTATTAGNATMFVNQALRPHHDHDQNQNQNMDFQTLRRQFYWRITKKSDDIIGT